MPVGNELRARYDLEEGAVDERKQVLPHRGINEVNISHDALPSGRA